jgi:uncharacterized protein (TIGR00369 family)
VTQDSNPLASDPLADDPLADDPLAVAKRILDAQPFSTLIRARVTAFGGGVARIEIPFEQRLLQQNGFLHGGVLAYAVDNAISFAGGSVLGPNILTAGMSVSYHRPARGPIVAEATVITSTRNSAAVRCEVTSIDSATGEPVIVASGHGTVSLVNRSDHNTD